jgi:hypothetical protein
MTTQNLKDNKTEIVAKIIELGCEDKMKTFMELMMMDAPYHSGTAEELVMSVFNTHYRKRAKRSGHMIAEICGNGIKANGTERNYSITKYL